jgi:hypothetical protein
MHDTPQAWAADSPGQTNLNVAKKLRDREIVLPATKGSRGVIQAKKSGILNRR